MIEDLQAIANGATMVCAAVLGLLAAALGLIEYVREDGFDPEHHALPERQRAFTRNVALLGAVLMALGIFNKAVFYLGLSCLEAAVIFWFMNRVPTQPPKLR